MSIIVIVSKTAIILSVNMKLSFSWIWNVTLISIIRHWLLLPSYMVLLRVYRYAIRRNLLHPLNLANLSPS
jgi:hypothetical protein